MTYNTYEIAIESNGSLRFLEVVACDVSSAIADVEEAMPGAFVSIRQI